MFYHLAETKAMHCHVQSVPLSLYHMLGHLFPASHTHIYTVLDLLSVLR